jgi:hypothetical protein
LLAPDNAQGRRVAIPAKRAHERGINLRIGFETIGDAGAVLDLTKEMAERRRPEPMKAFDEALLAKPLAHRKLRLLREGVVGYPRSVNLTE